MARSTGLVIAAGGIALANEVIFTSNQSVPLQNINWRIIPATAILAATLAGLETIAPGFAVSLAGLTVLAVLIIKTGNSNTPLENIAAFVNVKGTP